VLEPFVPFWAQTSALFVGWVSAWPMWTDPTQRSGPTQHSDLDPSAINVEPNGHNSPTHHRNQIQLRIVSGYLPGMARYRMRLLVPHVQLAIPAATREQALFKQTPFDADDELSVVIKLSL